MIYCIMVIALTLLCGQNVMASNFQVAPGQVGATGSIKMFASRDEVVTEISKLMLNARRSEIAPFGPNQFNYLELYPGRTIEQLYEEARYLLTQSEEKFAPKIKMKEVGNRAAELFPKLRKEIAKNFNYHERKKVKTGYLPLADQAYSPSTNMGLGFIEVPREERGRDEQFKIKINVKLQLEAIIVEIETKLNGMSDKSEDDAKKFLRAEQRWIDNALKKSKTMWFFQFNIDRYLVSPPAFHNSLKRKFEIQEQLKKMRKGPIANEAEKTKLRAEFARIESELM